MWGFRRWIEDDLECSYGIVPQEEVLLLFNKEDISKMKTMLTEDWIEIPDDGRYT